MGPLHVCGAKAKGPGPVLGALSSRVFSRERYCISGISDRQRARADWAPPMPALIMRRSGDMSDVRPGHAGLPPLPCAGPLVVCRRH